MVQWSTAVQIPEAPWRIGYGHKGLLLGSCFSERIGEKLAYYQFQQSTNPLGVVYHPAPIREWFGRIRKGEGFKKDEFFQHQGLWRHLLAHSNLADESREAATATLNQALETLREQLIAADYIILTLGTAWGFHHRETGVLAANCHKLPVGDFQKELSPVGAIEAILRGILGDLRALNPGATVVLTVSPVRHLRGGLVQNQRSKAHLISAAHALADTGDACYFPAYELLLDELRDYRFYASDLAHPSPEAVDHIWERFCETWLHPEAEPVMRQVESIRKGQAHRPLHPDSEASRAFERSLSEKIAELHQRYPFMDFRLE